MEKDDGGPAFPRSDERGQDGGGIQQGSSGMSLRDWFAGQALVGLIAQSPTADVASAFADHAWIMADAMLAARHDARVAKKIEGKR